MGQLGQECCGDITKIDNLVWGVEMFAPKQLVAEVHPVAGMGLLDLCNE
jgi:hypothetical protein